MYRTVVAWQIRRGWHALERRDVERVLGRFAPDFEYVFVGDHALGGRRTSRADMRAWFARLFRLLPGVHFDVRDVLVRGWPWATRAVVLVAVRADVGGDRYRNEVAQTIELRWGRIVRIRTLEDTQTLARLLERLAGEGMPEAVAAPIGEPFPALS